jgi:HEPN domain-containing protein
VNDGLAHGRYFFMDVARDGIALYQSDDTELHQPKPKTPHAALAMAREYFEEWFPTGGEFFDNFRFNLERQRLNNAAFQLHQATERLYHTVLLVVTFYTPHVHNLGFLRTQAERLDIRLVYVWPSDNRKQRAMFEKLKEAYVKARYSKHYRIGEEELAWLGEHVEELGRVVHAICSERIEQLEETARVAG